MVFLLGRTENAIVQNMVQKEANHHNDIIQGGFLDIYRRISKKTNMVLQWMTTFCQNVLFSVKVDDDAFVNYGQLLELLVKSDSDKKIIMGLYNSARGNEGQHVKGPMYIISGILIPELYKALLITPIVSC